MTLLAASCGMKAFLFVCFWLAASIVAAFAFSGVKRLERRGRR